jgi:hypothetical protein
MIVLFPLLLMLTPVAEAPVVGRPSEHFYGAVGEQVRVAMKASPTQLRVEEPLDLTLVIAGAANAEQIERPDLKQLPDFATRFHIDDLPEDAPPKGERVFRYHLRPKSERVRDVPPLLFHYWNPRLNYFATTATPESIALAVMPRSSPSAGGGPLDEPEFLFEMATEREMYREPLPDSLKMALLMAALLLPPLLCQAWFLVWRRWYPSAAKLAQMRRSKALREALDRLDEANKYGPQAVADEVAAVVGRYLHERFGVAANFGTPPEIAADLARRAVPPDVVADVEAFLRTCDGVRFAPPAANHESLIGRAKEVILNAEEAQ